MSRNREPGWSSYAEFASGGYNNPQDEREPEDIECRDCGEVYGPDHWFHAVAFEEERDERGRVGIIHPPRCPVCDPVGWEACPACQTRLDWANPKPNSLTHDPIDGVLVCPDCGCTEAFVL